jgi:hypothetical protein
VVAIALELALVVSALALIFALEIIVADYLTHAVELLLLALVDQPVQLV